MKKYTEEIEFQMQEYFKRLNQKEKRQYSALEAMKLSRGGKKYRFIDNFCQLTVNKQKLSF